MSFRRLYVTSLVQISGNHICSRSTSCIPVTDFVLLNKELLTTTDIWHEILSIYNQLFPKLICGFIEYFVLLLCVTQSTLQGVLNPLSCFRVLRFLFLLFPQRNYSSLASVFLDALHCTWLRHSKALLLIFLFLVGIQKR